MKVLVGFLTVLLLAIGVVFFQYSSAYNNAVNLEEGIISTYKNNQNVLSSYTNRIAEMVQLPTMAKDDLKEIITTTFAGRYGPDGSKAVFQFISEQNLNIDQSMYKRIMNEISAGRKDFEMSQTKLVDLKRSYVSQLRSFYTGRVLMQNFGGFPTIKVGFPMGAPDEYEIIVADSAAEAFATGKDKPLQLRSQ